jgi:hypothetical protein
VLLKCSCSIARRETGTGEIFGNNITAADDAVVTYAGLNENSKINLENQLLKTI